MEPILHLSLPVTDLAAAKAFYLDLLGCLPGRESARTVDVWFLGMQLTLHELPEQVLTDQGVRHFGATLDRAELDALCDRIEQGGGTFRTARATRNEGTPHEETKAFVADPAGNLIELKAYADLTATVYAAADSYR